MSIPSKTSRPFAIVTGGSRGIGAAYARALAARGYALLLIARDRGRLDELADALRRDHGARVSVETLDLSTADAAHRLYAVAREQGGTPDLLINNAGFGYYGPFVEQPMPRIQAMLRLHVLTVVETMRLFLPGMIEQRRGAIINVASTAGFVPTAYLATYGATKTFLIRFSEAMAEEVRPHGIRIQACCPGTTTETEFHAEAGFQIRHPLGSKTATAVAETSLRALCRNRVVVTMDRQSGALDVLARWSPRRWVAWSAARWLQRARQRVGQTAPS